MKRAPLVAHLLVFLFACGSKSSPPPGSGDAGVPLTLMNLCDQLAQADCDRLDKCGDLKAPFDRAHCLERHSLVTCLPYQAVLARAVSQNEVTYFDAAAAACRAKVASLDCSIGPHYDYLRETECQGLAGPMVQVGGKCSLPASCSPGLACVPGGSGCPGTCTKLGGNNDPCSASSPCSSGFFCAVPAMRCHAPSALHAPCETALSGNACVSGAYCDASQPGMATCVAGRGRGNGCTTPYQCAENLKCINATCSSGQIQDVCVTDDDCQPALRCAPSSRCAMPGKEGDACNAMKPCGEALICQTANPMATDGTCMPTGATGESCSGAKPCYLGRCTMGSCMDAAADGATCMGDADCLPWRTCTMGKCTLVEVSCFGG